MASSNQQPRKRGSRTRVCDTCGLVEQVRSDNKSTTCKSCAASKAVTGDAARQAAAARRNRKVCSCDNCGIEFERVVSAVSASNYCSFGCRKSHKNIERTCKCCGSVFEVPEYKLSGKTNSSGNFCKRECYNQWLCSTERKTGRGSRWHKIRMQAKELASFCAICGTFKNIDVHHIVPFRINQDNRQANLISLCKKHHKSVEIATVEAIATGIDTKDLWLVMHAQLTERQEATYQKLKELGYRKSYEPSNRFQN